MKTFHLGIRDANGMRIKTTHEGRQAHVPTHSIYRNFFPQLNHFPN